MRSFPTACVPNMCVKSTLDTVGGGRGFGGGSYIHGRGCRLVDFMLAQFPNLKALNFRGPPLTFLPHKKVKASFDRILISLCHLQWVLISFRPIPTPPCIHRVNPRKQTNNLEPPTLESVGLRQMTSRVLHFEASIRASARQVLYGLDLLNY